MNKTVAALATPPGIGGLAIIRISGDDAFNICDRIFYGKSKITDAKSHTILYGDIRRDENIIDKVTISVYKSPNSYTGENVVEIGCHGGYLIYDEILNLLFENGATPAQSGEFTRRAFINGKLDLTQVEAVADIIHSQTVPGVLTAARQLNGNFTIKLKELREQLLNIASMLELELDFSEEGLEFIDKSIINSTIHSTIAFCSELTDNYRTSEILRSGFFITVAGYPNSGKSTLFNRLINKNRSIVSHIPGTTRDYIEENFIINGITIKLYDTAGLRDSKDIIEIEGIKFVETLIEQSNLIIFLNDIYEGRDHSDVLINKITRKYPKIPIIIVHNKIDLVNDIYFDTDKEIFISSIKGIGIQNLQNYIYKIAKESADRINDILINQRHISLLELTKISLMDALKSLQYNMENEIIAIDIRKAVKYLGEMTGESWNEEVLYHIFSKFCIGK